MNNWITELNSCFYIGAVIIICGAINLVIKYCCKKPTVRLQLNVAERF